jgi:hypothetical protein
MSKAIKTKGSLERRDVQLTFGETNTLSTSYGPFGYSASATDGTYIDTGNTDLEGMGVAVRCSTGITASGSPSATVVSVKLSGSANKGSSWSTIGEWTADVSALGTSAEALVFPIPRGYGDLPLLKLEAKVTFTGGTTPAVTAGKLYGWIDAYGAE